MRRTVRNWYCWTQSAITRRGPDADQFDATVEAAREADLIFFVTHARNPGRDADVKLWHKLKEWFVERPELKMPPVLIALTHVDLLSPAMEWSPPYDWHHPSAAKRKNIAEAAQVVREQFGDGVAAIVPVCKRRRQSVGCQGRTAAWRLQVCWGRHVRCPLCAAWKRRPMRGRSKRSSINSCRRARRCLGSIGGGGRQSRE